MTNIPDFGPAHANSENTSLKTTFLPSYVWINDGGQLANQLWAHSTGSPSELH